MLTFQRRVEESKEFVKHLNPLYPSNVKHVTPEKAAETVYDAKKLKAYYITSNSADRNFRKQYNVRRNGIAEDSARKRIPCEKSRKLQREADNAEHNNWHIKTAKREMQDGLAETLFVSPFSDAWHLVCTHFSWMSCRARRTLLNDIRSSSIVDSSTKRRRKMKGGGSFNAYGSEGPGRRMSGKQSAHHASENVSEMMGLHDSWMRCHQGLGELRVELSMDTAPMVLRKYNGTKFLAFKTAGDGACAIHATFEIGRAHV